MVGFLLLSACGDSSPATIPPTVFTTQEPTASPTIQVVSPPETPPRAPTESPPETPALLPLAIVPSTPLAGDFRANPKPPLVQPSRISSPPLSERIIAEESSQNPGVVWSQEGSWDTPLFEVEDNQWLLTIEMDRSGGPDIPIHVSNADRTFVQHYVATFYGRYDTVEIPLVGAGPYWIRIDTDGSYDLRLEGTISILER